MRRATTILLIALGAMMAGGIYQTHRVHSAVEGLSKSIVDQSREEALAVLEATWKDKLGVTHSVKTEQRFGESYDEWVARHKAAVEALQAIFPPAT